MTEFWVSSGHHLAGRTEGGGLAVTDALLLAYLARPELVPPAEACAAERALYDSLRADPRRPVSPAELARLADPDAVENWQVILAFRDRLLRARSVEAAYLDIVRAGTAGTPGLFLNQLVHLILRNALDGCEDPFALRAGEMFFRPQRISLHEGATLAADAELIEAREGTRSPLMAMFGHEPAAELDVMTGENAWTYWSRSDAFTMALNLSGDPRARDGLARAIEAWLAHLLGLTVRVAPIPRIEEPDWRWFIGLDAEATAIGNALWRGEPVEPEAQTRVLALFRMEVADEARLDPKVAGHPIYLIMAMNADKRLTLKPQNLVVGLPLADSD
ncbi:DUF6352 family protein [Methylobacterium sp. A54F]